MQAFPASFLLLFLEIALGGLFALAATPFQELSRGFYKSTGGVLFVVETLEFLRRGGRIGGAQALLGTVLNIKPLLAMREGQIEALEKVRADKLREVKAGHDGTWVAHPGLVPIAMEVFDAGMPQPNQIATAMPAATITAKDLLTVPGGPVTEKGLRQNLNVGILYLEAWLRGNGCVPLYNLMEDAATAEISRTQVWQWLRHRAALDDGRRVDEPLVRALLASEMEAVRAEIGAARFEGGRFADAVRLVSEMMRQYERVDLFSGVVLLAKGERILLNRAYGFAPSFGIVFHRPVAEKNSDVDQRIAHGAHLPIQYCHDARRIERIQHHVVELEVAMDHAGLVRGGEPVGRANAALVERCRQQARAYQAAGRD